jgi:hypothetical protein
LKLYEDWDLRIRLTRTVQVACCKEVLSEYRQHGKSLSQAHIEDHISALDSIVAKNLPLLDDSARSDQRYVVRSIGKWRAGIVERAAINILDMPADSGGGGKNLLPLLRYFKFQGRIYPPLRLTARAIFGRRLYQKIVELIKGSYRPGFDS